ncbi:MAG: diguanylate cyclase [Gammaproteobacteria bacterium]|nr:MAG: diguanylate cyclase [Gammaproteobacteria bacterium]
MNFFKRYYYTIIATFFVVILFLSGLFHFEAISWGLLVLLLMLALIPVMTIRLLQKEFIIPTTLLLKQIENENKGIDAPIPKVPLGWYPWFKKVSKSFKENRQLSRQLEISLSHFKAKNVGLQKENQLLEEQISQFKLQISNFKSREEKWKAQNQLSNELVQTNACMQGFPEKIPVKNTLKPKSHKILVVDDDNINRRVLVSMLSLKNYTTIEASSGIETLTLIENGSKPDIILMDVMMPDLTGLEVTRKLRETWQADELPILLVTANTQVANIVEGLESGANDYMKKPVFKDELLAKVKTHLYIKELKASVKENEKKLRKFLEAVPVGIGVLDASGKPCYFNHKALQLFGKDIAPNTTSEQLSESYKAYRSETNQLYPSEKLPVVRALQGESTSVDDIEIHQSDKTIPIEVWGTPIFDEHNNIAYAIAAFQDITERKRAEKERIRMTDELAKLNAAYERFVPRKFLALLDKKSVLDVQLGDQVEKEITLLFCDIREFTSISEEMTPQDNFNFINAYLSRMEPIITQHHGMIDKYIGDSIMALFPTRVDDAVQAAINLLKRLSEYNLTRGRPKRPIIKIGIGLNSGLLMLGTVGGKNRMDGTVISDAVNLASRVEGLTKIYGVSLLITEYTYAKLSKPLEYHIRVIDAVKVKGKSQEVTIYEIFDADQPEIITLKEQTLSHFKEGFVLYHCDEFNDARPFFEKVLQVNKNDKVAQIYLKRCEYFQKYGVSDDWENIEALLRIL